MPNQPYPCHAVFFFRPLFFSPSGSRNTCGWRRDSNPVHLGKLGQKERNHINGKNKTEIIAYDSTFTIDRLTYYIKEIIHSRTYSIENFNRLLIENEETKNKNTELLQKIDIQHNKINDQTIEINELKRNFKYEQ